MWGEEHGQETAAGADPELGLEPESAARAGDEQVSGLIRRVRRLARWSQRELAHELGVTQSAVAKWETGRTTPTARMLVRILQTVELSVVAVRQDGERVKPMKVVAARDAAGRRYPAHTFVWAEGWWVPEGAETTAFYDQILWRSKVLELPRVRYSRSWRHGRRRPSIADVDDHPTWSELVAEAKESWNPQCRNVLPIPEWSFADTHKSRNRRPEDFGALARHVSLGQDRRRADGRAAWASVETRPDTERMRQ